MVIEEQHEPSYDNGTVAPFLTGGGCTDLHRWEHYIQLNTHTNVDR